MPTANTLPTSRTLEEIFADWKSRKFTGIAIVNVHLGIPKSIEYGRPDRVVLDYSEHTMLKNLLTSGEPSP